MFRFLLVAIFIISAWQFSDWKNWKLYYPTILYMQVGDLTYCLVSKFKPLWQFESPYAGKVISELIVVFIKFPCLVLLFISNCPSTRARKIMYILAWIFLYTFVEFVSYQSGAISYHNGWNIFWSFGFNCLMFPLLILHYKKPLWVWPISLVLGFLTVISFNLPLN